MKQKRYYICKHIHHHDHHSPLMKLEQYTRKTTTTRNNYSVIIIFRFDGVHNVLRGTLVGK